MPGINMPREKPSALDEIGQALNIAGGVYGIINKKQELNLQQEAIKEKQLAEKNKAEGNLSQGDIYRMRQQGVEVIDPGSISAPPPGFGQVGNLNGQPVFGKKLLQENPIARESLEFRKDEAKRAEEAKKQTSEDKRQKDLQDRVIPGLGIDHPVFAKDKKQADETAKITESFKNLTQNTDDLISLRNIYGAEFFNREAVSDAKQLASDTQLQAKNLYQLGVLSNSDLMQLNKIIPEDPLKVDITADTPAQLSKFKELMSRKMANYLKTRGLGNDDDIEAFSGISRSDFSREKTGAAYGADKPQRVFQGGHWYNLNPKTGEYE